MSLKQLFLTHDGRIPRSLFWRGFLIMFAIQVPIQIVVYVAVLSTAVTNADYIAAQQSLAVFQLILSLAAFYPALCISIKRLHDRNRSGWFYLLLFVPIANIWIFIELAFLKGTDGHNNFGSDPLAGRGSVRVPPVSDDLYRSDNLKPISNPPMPAANVQQSFVAPKLAAVSEGPGWVLSGMDATGRPLRVSFKAGDFEGVPFLWIGRTQEHQTIHISDSTVSRKHAKLGYDGSDLWLIDAGSKNGTMVNGNMISSTGGGERLTEGAQVQFGKAKLFLSTSSAGG